MKRRYHIAPKKNSTPTDAELARYQDPNRLVQNYHRAVRRPRVPLYRDPKAFLALLLIVLLAILLTEVVEDRKNDTPVPTDQQSDTP